MKSLIMTCFVAGLLVGCGDDNPSVATNNEATSPNQAVDDGCTPSRSAWDAEIGTLVQTHCGNCHGESPDFGAPYSLTSYDQMVSEVGGEQVASRVAARVAFGTMPPAGVPDLPDPAIQKITEWASCGTIEPELGTGLKVDRPVFMAPEAAPDLPYFDVVADDFVVGEEVLDLYQCFTVDAPVTSDKFIRRLEVVVDESEVIHHVVLLRDPEQNAPEGRHECPGMPANSDYLYAWAPGGGAVQFPDGGLRVTPGERFVLQIHYNNAVGKADVEDATGVRLYYDEPAGTEYGMVAPGPLAFRVDPSSTQEVEGVCRVQEETTVIAGMPHMHEIGEAFRQVLERADGTVEPVISLENWEFETQLFYSIPITMMPGDILRTTCRFENTSTVPVRSGERTSDEMCFNFMYVTPPPTSRYCDSGADTPPTDIDYAAGACLPEPPFDEPNLSIGSFVFGEPPPASGGELLPGDYELTGFTIYRENASTPVGDIDPEASLLLAKGQLVVTDTEASFDADFETNAIVGDGQTFNSSNDISIAGTWTVDGTSLEFDLTCPEPGTPAFGISVDGETVTLQRPGEAFSVGFVAVYEFERR